MKKEEFKKSLKKITDFQTTITQKKQKQIQKKVIKVAESPIYGKKGFYRGEILNNKPNGYGIFIYYEKHKIRQKVLGISSQINHIYLGEWVNGKFDGYGRLISYIGLEWGCDKDGMPKIAEEDRGNFKKGELVKPYHHFTEDYGRPPKWICYKCFDKNGKYKMTEIKNIKFQKPGSFTMQEMSLLLGVDLKISKKIFGAELKKKFKIELKANVSLYILERLVNI